MAMTRQDYRELLYPTGGAVSHSPASLSIKDFANQTGLNQTLSDYQDAYAEAVLSGSKAGKDILAQGDKAFSSQWYEILQNALRAALASRATGGELGTDFTDALSTTLAAMQEASAGATTQQNAYVNLANQIATALAEAGVNSMSAFQQQGANLAQSYPALMEALAMQDSNLLAQFVALLEETEQGTRGGTVPAPAPAPAPAPTSNTNIGGTTTGATVFAPLNPGAAGPIQVIGGDPYALSGPGIQPDQAALDQVIQDAFRKQIIAEGDGTAWVERALASQAATPVLGRPDAADVTFGVPTAGPVAPGQSQMRQLLDYILAGQQAPDPQINRATTRLPAEVYAAGVGTKPAYDNLGLGQLWDGLRQAMVPKIAPQTDAQWAEYLNQNRINAQAPLAVAPVAETEEERKRRIDKLYNNRGLATQIAAARANAAKQSAAQQATAIAQAVRPAAKQTSSSSSNPRTGTSFAPIVSALNKAAAASGSSRSSGSRSSGGSGSSTRVSATAPSLSAVNKAATVLAKKKGTSSGLPGSNYSVTPKAPSLSNTIGSAFNSYKPSTSYAGYSSSDIAKRKALAKQGEME